MPQIPREVIDFCTQKGNLLLIKGEAGTGKTILSLELLQYFSQKRDRINTKTSEQKNGVYLSTKVSPKRLLEQFPFLNDIIKSEHVLNAETRYDHSNHPSKAFEVLDLRIREAPALIDNLYSLASRFQNPFMLVDSWDAIAAKLGPESTVKMEDWLEVLITKTDANLILVSEEPGPTRMDYLADGVVTLSKARHEDRLIREKEICKLRGVRVEQDKYLFTLENGKFKYFKPWRWQTIPEEKRKLPPLQEDKNPQTVSTCVRGLDVLLGGGWKKGSFNLLEIGEGVGNDYFALVVPAALSFLNMGRTFRSFSSGWEIEHLTNSLSTKLTKKFEERMLFIRITKTPMTGEANNMVYVDPAKKLKSDYWKRVSRIEEKSKDGVVLEFVDTEVIERDFGPEMAMSVLSREADNAKSSHNVDLATLKEGQKLSKDVEHLASTHWRLKRRDGVLIFYGVVPNTGIYVIETSFHKGYPETTITPIV